MLLKTATSIKRMVEKPRGDERPEKLAVKFPGKFPASVVTRSMKAKREAISEQVRRKLVSGTREEIGLRYNS